MPVVIAPISIANPAEFQRRLNTAAREKRYLAQIEALPSEKIEEFVRESVDNDAVQFVAVDGMRVVGWADILPASMSTFRTQSRSSSEVGFQ